MLRTPCLPPANFPNFSSPVIGDAALALDILSCLTPLEHSDLSLERQSRLLSVLAHIISRHAYRKLGLPPHAYLIQKRIDHARRLLSEGLPVTEVSL